MMEKGPGLQTAVVPMQSTVKLKSISAPAIDKNDSNNEKKGKTKTSFPENSKEKKRDNNDEVETEYEETE